jgi:hypothetical protein
LDRRAFAAGLFGWIVPGILAFLLVGTHESAGGEAALGMLIVWWALGVIGCAIAGIAAGALGRGSGNLGRAFQGGLAGVCVSWIAAIAAEAVVTMFVSVLHTGGLTLLMPVPFVLGYGAGFGLAAILSRPVGPGTQAGRTDD